MSHGTFHTDPWCPCKARKTKSAFWFAASFEAGTLCSQVQTSFWAHSAQGLLVNLSQHWAEDQPESEPRRVAPKLDHQAMIPLPAHKMYYRALHDLSPYWLLHVQDKCSVVFTWGCTEEGSGKKKHKGNRKRKRQTRFCFINWKWLALWKPLFFGFRNLPHTHTKKSNSIEGHEYYTENCFPFINHFCECELIILASILLLAGSKLSWTKKKVPLNQNHFPLPMAAFGHLC